MDLGREYDVALSLLKSTGKRAEAVSCPQPSGDGCPRRVIETETGGIRGICDSRSSHCDPLDLTRDDVIVLTLDKPTLVSRIGKALSLSAPKKADAQASVWHVGDRVTANGAHVPVYFAIVGAQDAEKTSIFAPMVAGMQPSLLIVPTAFTLSVEQTGYLAKSSVTARPVSELLAVAKDGRFSATPLADHALGELESTAFALSSNAPKRAWQLPPGTEWPKVKIDFISDEVINVSCGTAPARRFEPDQISLKNKKTGKPKDAWVLLKQFALFGGSLPKRAAEKPEIIEKQKQELSRSLRNSFGLDSDPIKVVNGAYRTLFVASATGLSQGQQGQVARNFGRTKKKD